jgi:RNA polymerase sigma-70 factor (ECF subfamily)
MAAETEQLWQQLHTGIRGFVSRRVRNPADVDDVVQRVFLQVHRGLPSLRDGDRVHAWVYRTARHAIVDYYRGPVQRRELASGGLADFADAPDTADSESGEDEGSIERDFAGCMRPLLRSLEAPDVEALTLVDVEGLTQADAAKRLNLSVSGMKSRVQRARRRFRAVVDECCRVQLDRRGGVIGYERRKTSGCDGCEDSGCGDKSDE